MVLRSINGVLSYVEPTLGVCYLLVIFVIFFSPKNEFRQPFYVFFITTGIGGIMSIVVALIVKTFFMSTYIHTSLIFVIYVTHIISGASSIIIMIGKIYMSVNQLLMIAYIKRTSYQLSQTTVAWLTLAQFVVAFGVHIFFVKAELIPSEVLPDGRMWLQGYGWTTDYLVISRCVYAGCGVIYIISESFLALVSCHKLQHASDDMHSDTRARLFTHERRLAIYTMVCSFFQCLKCAHQIIWALSAITKNTALLSVVELHYFWVNDLAIFSTPLLFFAVNTRVRAAFLESLPFSDFQSRSVLRTTTHGKESSVRVPDNGTPSARTPRFITI